MCITRGEVLQIYEELGIFCWIAYKCFCLLTLLGCGIPFDRLRDRAWGLREREGTYKKNGALAGAPGLSKE
jgi:hypothetical protein